MGCKEDTAMELYDAHVAAKTALDSAACSKKGKKHNKKDEDAPKRTVSSYMYFAKEKRQSVQKKNPKSSPTEISKLLGEMWNKLVKEKEEYDVVVQKRNVVSEQENEESFQQDKVEAMKLYLKLNKISADITSKVVDENNQCKQASAVISDDVKKVY